MTVSVTSLAGASGSNAIQSNNAAEFSSMSGRNTRKWRNAVANVRAGTRNAKLALIGDSTTAGLFSNGNSNFQPKAYPTVLAQLLSAAGLPAHANSFWGGQTYPDPVSAYDPRISLGAGWSFGLANTLGGSLLINSTTSNPVTFTPTEPVDTFDIWIIGNGNFDLSVNGGSTTTLAGTTWNNVHKVTYTVPLGVNALSLVRGSNPDFYIIGFDAYNSTQKSVSVWNMGAVGSTAETWVATTSNWGQTNALQQVAPDLSIICLTINDNGAGTAIATYKARMQTLITAALVTGDVILMVGVPEATSRPSFGTQNLYADANYDLAATNNLPLIDLQSRFVSHDISASLYFDEVHPNAAGYAVMAATVAKALGQI